MKKNNKGFTLIELMITVSIISIMLAIASPSFSEFIKNNKIMTTAKIFNSDINYAKSEALKGNAKIVIKSVGGSFANGWQIFKDVNNNNTYDAGDTILRQQDPLASNQVVSSSGGDYIAFNTYGETAQALTTFKFCDGRTGNFGKSISVNSVGLIKFTDSTC